MSIRYLILFLLFCFISTWGYAQMYTQSTDTKFGRNRIQYKQFEWRYLSSENFDIYFYQGGERIAKEVSEYLENEFDRITDLIGYPPYNKTKLFLYNSVTDLQQSNVGIDQQAFTPGGETEFIKPYVEVAHPGSISALKEELLYKVSMLMVNEMMFGGSLKDMFQNAVLLNLPEWFISGAANYVAHGWSIEMDDFMRDYIETKNPQKLSKLTGKEAALAGQSVWNFIAQKYGKSNISNILNYTRIIRNEEKSIGITLGIPFNQMMYEWTNFYIDMDRSVDEAYIPPSDDFRITSKNNRRNIIFDNVRLNPKGDRLAYTTNDIGKFSIKVMDLTDGNEKTIMRGGARVINQQYETHLPVIDWVDSLTLGIIHSKHGQMFFTLYDLKTNSKLPRPLRRFERVKSLDFSDNGRLAIVSGTVNGRSDLYLLSTRRDRVRRIMNDVYDDIDPTFMPNSNTIVFSSNRPTDTLDVDTRDLEEVGDNYNLFFYSLDTTKNVVFRVTNTVSRDYRPIGISSNEIIYLSDQKGIINLYKYDVLKKIYTQLTNFNSSIESYDFNRQTTSATYVLPDEADDYLYYEPSFDVNNQIFTKQTPRQQFMQVKAFRERKAVVEERPKTIQEIIESRLQQRREQLKQDSIQREKEPAVDTLSIKDPNFIDTDNYTFDVPTDTLKQQEDVINTADYKFETDVIEEKQAATTSFLEQYRKLRSQNDIAGPFEYEPRFSAKNLTTSFRIDPLRGFSILLETEMYDILENHKFSGGILAATDLRSGDVMARYDYLKHTIDYSAKFTRNVLFLDSESHKYSLNTLELGAALPLTTKLRLGVYPFYSFSQFDNIFTNTNPPRFTETTTNHFIGVNSELVYDNSIINGMNLIEGTRGKITFTHYEGTTDKDLSFSRIKADVRHYQKIHKEIVLAGRLFYGKFFGRDPKNFLLGGMDNWLFNDRNERGDGNPLNTSPETNHTDLLFTEFATNLRGFDYATIYGENVLLFNAELRLPIVRYLSHGPIASNFFRNLQFTGFFDIGSAWTGASPFNEDNNISSERIEQGNFIINLKNFRNPWLYSYGVGFRTILLGYYAKLDVAWPVEDFEVQDTRFMVTIGYDF